MLKQVSALVVTTALAVSAFAAGPTKVEFKPTANMKPEILTNLSKNTLKEAARLDVFTKLSSARLSVPSNVAMTQEGLEAGIAQQMRDRGANTTEKLAVVNAIVDNIVNSTKSRSDADKTRGYTMAVLVLYNFASGGRMADVAGAINEGVLDKYADTNFLIKAAQDFVQIYQGMSIETLIRGLIQSGCFPQNLTV